MDKLKKFIGWLLDNANLVVPGGFTLGSLIGLFTGAFRDVQVVSGTSLLVWTMFFVAITIFTMVLVSKFRKRPGPFQMIAKYHGLPFRVRVSPSDGVVSVLDSAPLCPSCYPPLAQRHFSREINGLKYLGWGCLECDHFRPSGEFRYSSLSAELSSFLVHEGKIDPYKWEKGPAPKS